ncbi:HNH endonuclease [Serratia proteamaculans]
MDEKADRTFTDEEKSGYLNKLPFFFEEKERMPECPYCNNPMEPEHAAVDHIIPFKTYARYLFLKYDGKDIDTVLNEDVYNTENFCLCCNRCNSSKRNSLDTKRIGNAIDKYNEKGLNAENFIKSLEIAEDIISGLPVYVSLYCMIGCYWEIDYGSVNPAAIADKFERNNTYTIFRGCVEEVDISEVVQWLSQIRCINGENNIQYKGEKTGQVDLVNLWSYTTPLNLAQKNKAKSTPRDPNNKAHKKFMEPVQFFDQSLLTVLKKFHNLLELVSKEQKIFKPDIISEQSDFDTLSSIEAPLPTRNLPKSFSVEDGKLVDAYDYSHMKNITAEDISGSMTVVTDKNNTVKRKGKEFNSGKLLRKYLSSRQLIIENEILLYHCCYYCLGFYPPKSFQIDHINPRLKKDHFHKSSNLLAVCQGCNNSKRSKNLTLSFLDERVDYRSKLANVSGLEDVIIISFICDVSKIDIAKGIQAYVLRKHIEVPEGVGYFAVSNRIKKITSLFKNLL